ncbi:CubicO group peptidase, beta-lactamase class C family [Sunxiuqinia elliptica]|uniref:CubicO group peptidase, beta-lactamase class C family n=2 Tax=Sunxiuqinia elliptica TaxID=655355 RepID=A0A1I2J2N4_9BACT|nr:CubicO group peptidase, beta-lactamase class C family [Sunxiuqinia elliptica]
MHRVLQQTMAPGFAVAIVEKDKIIYSEGFGYSDYENKIPVDANTLFAIGSTSKAFTSALLGQLRDDNKLSFNDSPIKYIPELKFYNDELNNNVIIEDLMCHRTGLSRHDLSWYLFPTFDKDSLIRRVQYLEPFSGIRQKWHYNNFMFLVQGVITERITGKSWEANITDLILKPLSMDRSNTSITELEQSDNAALGYKLRPDSTIHRMDYYHIAAMSPAGSINSSVNEMGNWLITWINKGKFKGEQIIPEAYINEAITSHMTIGGLPSKQLPELHFTDYGYGWFVSSYKGHYKVDHGGNIDGFSAKVTFFPTDSLGIVVLTNQDRSALPSLVTNILADRLLQEQPTDWLANYNKTLAEALKKMEKETDTIAEDEPTDTPPSHPAEAFAGKYGHPGYGDISVTAKNDSLFANFRLKKFYLKNQHYNVFETCEVTETGIDTTDNNPLRLNFRINDDGELSSIFIRIERALDHPLEFKRLTE